MIATLIDNALFCIGGVASVIAAMAISTLQARATKRGWDKEARRAFERMVELNNENARGLDHESKVRPAEEAEYLKAFTEILDELDEKHNG